MRFEVREFVNSTEKKNGKTPKSFGEYDSFLYPPIGGEIKVGTKKYTVNSIIRPENAGRLPIIEVMK